VTQTPQPRLALAVLPAVVDGLAPPPPVAYAAAHLALVADFGRIQVQSLMDQGVDQIGEHIRCVLVAGGEGVVTASLLAKLTRRSHHVIRDRCDEMEEQGLVTSRHELRGNMLTRVITATEALRALMRKHLADRLDVYRAITHRVEDAPALEDGAVVEAKADTIN